MKKVAELNEYMLNYWVARAEGMKKGRNNYVGYSTDWSQGGPIIDREGISVIKEYEHAPWRAGKAPTISVRVFNDGGGHFDTEEDIEMMHEQSGETALIAAMRCYVSSKFGKEVDDS